MALVSIWAMSEVVWMIRGVCFSRISRDVRSPFFFFFSPLLLSPRKKKKKWNADSIVCLVVTVSNVSITNSKNRVLLNLYPNSFPATRYSARRDLGDDSPIEYIQVRKRAMRCDLPLRLTYLRRAGAIFRILTSLHPPQYLHSFCA